MGVIVAVDPKSRCLASAASLVQVSEIRVGRRCRKEVGDIEALKESLSRLGMLQPIVLDSGTGLVSGWRRLQAAKALGWSEVPAVTVSGIETAIQRLQAERDENCCREDMTAPEKANLVRALLPLEAEEAKRAQREAGGDKKSEKAKRGPIASAKVSEAFAATDERRAMTKAARAVGWGRTTAKRAIEVLEKVESAPRKHAAAAALLDKGNVSGAYRAVQRTEAPLTKPSGQPVIYTHADLNISNLKPWDEAVARIKLRTFLGRCFEEWWKGDKLELARTIEEALEWMRSELSPD